MLARGENPTGGFDTRFARAEGAHLELLNVPPEGPATQMITSFELSGGLPAEGTQQDVAIRVAGEDERVAVARVPRLQ